jgi:7-cyano-7-deazaguanine synthase in queuosine biosynthesis
VVIEIGNQLIVEFTQHIKTQWFDKSNQFVPPLLVSRCPSQEQQHKKHCEGCDECDVCHQFFQDLIPQEVSKMDLRTHRPFAGNVFVGSTG